MKKLLSALSCVVVFAACEPKKNAPTPKPTPTATKPTPVPAEGCLDGDRSYSRGGQGAHDTLVCQECRGGKWKPCKD